MLFTVQVARLASNGQDTLQCLSALAKVRWTTTSAIAHFWTSQLVHTQQRPACLLTSAVKTATAMLAVQEVLIFACEKGPQWQLAMGLFTVQATKMVPYVISCKLR